MRSPWPSRSSSPAARTSSSTSSRARPTSWASPSSPTSRSCAACSRRSTRNATSCTCSITASRPKGSRSSSATSPDTVSSMTAAWSRPPTPRATPWLGCSASSSDHFLEAFEMSANESPRGVPTTTGSEPTTVLPDTASQLGEVEQLQQALVEADERAKHQREQYLRAVAELDNVRKRAQRDIEAANRYGLEKFAAELLPVKDS